MRLSYISLPAQEVPLASPSQATATPGRTNNRVLSSRIVGKPDTSIFDTGAPAAPYVPPSASLAPSHRDPFDDRLGNSTSSQVRPPHADLRNIRELSSPVLPPGWSRSPPGAPNKVPQQPGPLGIFTGPPLPDYPVPPAILGLPGRSAASDDDTDDWFARWIKAYAQ